MREITLQEKGLVSGGQLPTSGTQTVSIPGGGSATIDFTSVNEGLAGINAGLAQVQGGNTAQGLSWMLAGAREVLGDISVSTPD
jgi:hypothetical protein